MVIFYDRKTRKLMDENRLTVANDVNPEDGKAIVAAFEAARLLCIAYANGEAMGGDMEWEEVGEAYESALRAVGPQDPTVDVGEDTEEAEDDGEETDD